MRISHIFPPLPLVYGRSEIHQFLPITRRLPYTEVLYPQTLAQSQAPSFFFRSFFLIPLSPSFSSHKSEGLPVAAPSCSRFPYTSSRIGYCFPSPLLLYPTPSFLSERWNSTTPKLPLDSFFCPIRHRPQKCLAFFASGVTPIRDFIFLCCRSRHCE